MGCTSWTEQDLIDIEKAIATGAMTVRYEDRTVTYRSLEEMSSIRDAIKKCLDPTTPPGASPYGGRRFRVATHKDLD